MTPEKRERRRSRHPASLSPRRSPVNHLVLTVLLVIGATAAATAMLGPRFDEATPHGQILAELQRAATAQADHYRANGAFAIWVNSLELAPNPDVQLTILRGDSNSWEMMATHDVGLGCTQAGRVENGRKLVKDAPFCFREEPANGLGR